MKNTSLSRLFLISALLLSSCRTYRNLDQKLVSSDENVRAAAITQVQFMSIRQKAALIPLLINHLRSQESQTSQRASDALSLMGTEAVKPLVACLTDPEVFTRLMALSALERMGATARRGVPAITESLNDPHPLVRDEAAAALRAIQKEAPFVG